VVDRESCWAELMQAANRGDGAAYHCLLKELVPVLRRVVSRGFAHRGLGSGDAEDVVQETLLAVHLKRHTWDERQRLFPWIQAIAHNKLIDNLRRRGRRAPVPIDDIAENTRRRRAGGRHERLRRRAHHRPAEGTPARHRDGNID